MPGIITSSRIRSGGALRAMARALGPEGASLTWYIGLSRLASRFRLVGASSTTSTVSSASDCSSMCMMTALLEQVQCAFKITPVHGRIQTVVDQGWK